MAYTIVKSDGTILTTIPDGTINTDSTSVGLPGRYFAGYGQTVDTNFVHIIENFANTTPPANPLKGQIWFNTNDNFLYVCPTDGETNQNVWIKLAVTSTNATSTFGGVIVTGNLQANNILANSSITGNSITVNYANVNTLATMSSANIYGNAQIGNLTTRVITTGAATTTGSMTGTWTVTGGAVGNTLIVDGGNLYVSSGIIASSFTFPNGTPISPTGGYTNQNVNEYLQGTGNISPANRFQGNIYPNTVYMGSNGVANSSAVTIVSPSNIGNASFTVQGETNSNVLGIFRSYGSASTGNLFSNPTANAVVIGGFGANLDAFMIGTNESAPVIFAAAATEKMRLTTTGFLGIGTSAPTSNLHIIGTSNITGDTILGSTLSVTGNTTISGNLSVTGNATVNNISIPGIPRFLAHLGAPMTSGTTIIFNEQDYDNGNNYDPVTGVFTAPETGVYLFTFSVKIVVKGGTTLTFEIIPVQTPAPIFSLPSFGYENVQSQAADSKRTISGSFIVSMTKNDQIKLTTSPAASAASIYVYDTIDTFFNGAKIA